jgi:hypothetical protein
MPSPANISETRAHAPMGFGSLAACRFLGLRPARRPNGFALVGLLTPELALARPSRRSGLQPLGAAGCDNGQKTGPSCNYSVTAAGPSRIFTGVPCLSALQPKRPTTSTRCNSNFRHGSKSILRCQPAGKKILNLFLLRKVGCHAYACVGMGDPAKTIMAIQV